MSDHRRRKERWISLRRLDDAGRLIEAAAWMIFWAAVGASLTWRVVDWVAARWYP